MNYLAARVRFEYAHPSVGADLIGSVFADLGIQGIVIDDPTAEPQVDWAEDALERPTHHAVTGFLPMLTTMGAICRRLEKDLDRLRRRSGLKFQIAYQKIDEQDWSESWKPFFKIQHIGKHLVVKPSWQAFVPEPDDCVIELDPGMAFGTGAHPTTILCLQLLEKYLEADHNLLDIGTGSGILLVAAAHLCQGALCGIDSDLVAVSIARQNLLRNGVAPARFGIFQGDLVQAIKKPFECVTANIFTPVIVKLTADLPRFCAPGGILLCSGILETQKTLVLEALIQEGCSILECSALDGWVGIAARYRN